MKHSPGKAWPAFSLASLLYIRVWFEFNYLQQRPEHQYFLGRPADALDYGVAALGIALLTLLLLPLAGALRRQSQPMLAAAASVLTLILIGRVLYLATGLSETVPEILWWKIQDEAGALWFSGGTIAALLTLTVLLLAMPAARRALVRTGPVLFALLTMLAPFGLLMLAHAGLYALQATDNAPAATAAPANMPAATSVPGSPRVIVAVFDELDYRLAFETPPAGLALNGLRRLRESSLFATHAFPPSNSTAISMPAMLLGERLMNVQVDGWSGLNLYRDSSEHPDRNVVAFRDADTLVHRAVRTGSRVGMIGWYHPYCRLFPMAADCLASTAYGYATSYPGDTLIDRLKAQLRQVIPGTTPFAALRFSNAADRFRNMLADPSLGLVFAHFAVPHVPYIYDADLNRLTNADRMAPAPPGAVNYFANLLLVDRLVDETLDTMKASCADCILVVTSDHWWRWSRHFDGRTDRRVPFIVHRPDQGTARTLDKRFNNELLAHLVMAMLRRDVVTTDDVATWIGRHGKPGSPVFAPWMIDEDRMATSHDPAGMPR